MVINCSHQSSPDHEILSPRGLSERPIEQCDFSTDHVSNLFIHQAVSTGVLRTRYVSEHTQTHRASMKCTLFGREQFARFCQHFRFKVSTLDFKVILNRPLSLRDLQPLPSTIIVTIIVIQSATHIFALNLKVSVLSYFTRRMEFTRRTFFCVASRTSTYRVCPDSVRILTGSPRRLSSSTDRSPFL